MKRTYATVVLLATLVAATSASGVTVTDNATFKTLNLNETEITLTNGNKVTYNTTTGILEGYDVGNGIYLNMSTLSWSTAQKLIYTSATIDQETGAATTTNTSLGFNTKADGTLTGSWQGGDRTATVAASDLANTMYAVMNKSNGTYLYKGDFYVRSQLYGEYALRASSADTDTVYVNSALIESVTLRDAAATEYYVSNGDNTVSKTFSVADTQILDTTGKHQLTSLSKSNTVVAGATQLFLQTWYDDSRGQAVDISSNLYIGKTTYKEGVYSGVAIRFGNDGKAPTGETTPATTTLNGAIYVMEDAHIKSGGSNKIKVNGDVTDIIDETKANSTLKIEGKGYNFAGDVTVTGLEFVAGTQAQFGKGFNATSVTLGGTNTIITSDTVVGLTDLTVNAAGATLDSALQLSGGTLTMGASLAMGDNALVLNNMILSGSLYDSLATVLAEEGASVTLFTGVTGLAFDVATGIATEFTPVAAESVFTNLSQGAYLINLEQGNVTLTAAPAVPAVPEPTTATLSLLALAGLAARRRRK